MHIPNTFLRIIRLTGKLLLGIFLFLLIALAVIHLPLVQRQITRKLSDYLSDKLVTQVAIGEIDFSILGEVAVHDLQVWDRSQNQIFSAHQIAITLNPIDLIRGELSFNTLHLDGIDLKLAQSDTGLNIQFILDAFQSNKDTTASTTPVSLQLNKLVAENIAFSFQSKPGEMNLNVQLAKLESQHIQYSTVPNKISVEDLSLQKTIIDFLTEGSKDSATQHLERERTGALPFNESLGLIVELHHIQVNQSEFNFHEDEVMTPAKFDPAHLSLSDIQFDLSDVYVDERTISASLQSLSTQLPGFEITNINGQLKWDSSKMVVSSFNVDSKDNHLEAEFTGGNHPAELENVTDIEVTTRARLHPHDFAYFIPDSILNQVDQWQNVEFNLDASYHQGLGTLKTFALKTDQSRLTASGEMQYVQENKHLSWKNMEIQTLVGSDVKKLLESFVGKTQLPPNPIAISITSSGDTAHSDNAVALNSDWGNLAAAGEVNRLWDNLNLKIKLSTKEVDLGKWLDLPQLGLIDAELEINGNAVKNRNLVINGVISGITILDQYIHDLNFTNTTTATTSTLQLHIEDPRYRADIDSEIDWTDALSLTNQLTLDHVRLGYLLPLDSTLIVSGKFRNKTVFSQDSLLAHLLGDSIVFSKATFTHTIDSLEMETLLSPVGSNLKYITDNGNIKLNANFDLRELEEIIPTWTNAIVNNTSTSSMNKERELHLTMDMNKASLFQFLGINDAAFTSLKVTCDWNEFDNQLRLQGSSGKLRGFNVSMDTLQTMWQVHRDSISGFLMSKQLAYDSILLGNLEVDLFSEGDTVVTELALSRDSLTLLGFALHFMSADSGIIFYPDKLMVNNKDYSIDPNSSVRIDENTTSFNHLSLSNQGMEIKMDGSLDAFELSLRQVDLTPMNLLLASDTTIIYKGLLNSTVSYEKDHRLTLRARVDSLVLYESLPLTVTANADRIGNQIPFDCTIDNESNQIVLHGDYLTDVDNMDAALRINIHNPEMFTFLIADYIKELHGTLDGVATVNGPILQPDLNGYLHFLDAEITTSNPGLTFTIPDDRVIVNHSALQFQNFKLLDAESHPLTINGRIFTQDYRSFSYDLALNAENYKLVNRPDSTTGKINGQLVIDSDIKLKGNQKDTNIEALLTVKNDTHLTFVTTQEDVALLQAEGIVEFIDPAHRGDSSTINTSYNLYDSLLSSLPQFNLNSVVTVEEDASIRIIIDEQSGDYLETAGSAKLEMSVDRTGNLQLAGNYTVSKGVYRLSFYDLVKKNFNLVKGSTVNWTGDPKNGDLNIKAVHTVESNSLGLVGHEIGENEKSAYKRALDYEVGININGTIDKPIISFSLDLPEREKANFPVLANKLERLKLPEYESELNKQVFGLLVLGGFLPETTGADFNSSIIATTALSNSVNSLLASQLNRVANQYIKGVNIDVGIQSYSDYSAPGGKTQTAMDFRVSKRMMNDRLSFEIGGDFDISQDQSGANTGKNYRGDIAIIYDLTGNGDKQIKLFNNQTYDIIYQEIRNTGVSLVFIREFAPKEKNKQAPK